jgi:two-component system, chemotaxis family, chemotaxis protein CheY
MRAMVVDDSRAIRSMIGRILREIGFEVIEAVHGKDAWEKISQGVAPELVLVDWNMPEMDGLQFVQTVRRSSALRELVLVMVTTESEGARMVEALEAGANEYLMKPFTRDALIGKLDLLGIVHQ